MRGRILGQHRRNGPLKALRVDVIILANIHKHRGRAQQANHLGGGEKRKGGHEHGVPGANAPGHQRHEQGVGARSAGNAMPRLGHIRQLAFQFLNFRAKNKRAVLQNRIDAGADFFLNDFKLGF